LRPGVRLECRPSAGLWRVVYLAYPHSLWHSSAMAKSSTLTETAIRSALVERLRAECAPGHVLIEELGIENGAARVDLAVAGGLLEGFEIKSDLDTLDRLARQMHAYHRVFD